MIGLREVCETRPFGIRGTAPKNQLGAQEGNLLGKWSKAHAQGECSMQGRCSTLLSSSILSAC